MIRTLVIPFVVGFFCFLVAFGILSYVLPQIPMDDGVKGIIKIIVWIVSFAGPAEYLRKRAKEKLAQEAAS
jgi:type II secretory pathway component PulF